MYFLRRHRPEKRPASEKSKTNQILNSPTAKTASPKRLRFILGIESSLSKIKMPM